jgi:NhaP-type Na+/H+ or K+/H+ antiporter
VIAAQLTTSQIFVGIGLIFALAVGSQIVAAKLKIPGIIVLLPVGFIAGSQITAVNPNAIFGAAFSPVVSIAVAIILFDGGLDLVWDLKGHDRTVTHRLVILGIPITWLGSTLFAWLLLGLSGKAAIMLGAIVIVSGPTVVTPVLAAAQPGKRLTKILGYEGTTVDPIGAMIAVVVFHGLQAGHGASVLHGVLGFAGRVGIGIAGAAVGLAVLWFLNKIHVTGMLGIEAILATVVTVAAVCDAISADTGLIAAILMGVTFANIRNVHVFDDRPMLKTAVQLTIGLLFISISATVTPSSVRSVLWATLALVLCLVIVVRPIVAIIATRRTNLSRNERIFIGAMDPRGIVAASTAATFSASLIALGIDGANKLLPATFLVIVGTVAVYGLSATPLAKALGLHQPDADEEPKVNSP